MTCFLSALCAYSIRLKSIFTAENHFYCLIFAFGFHPAYKFVFRKNHIHAQLQSFILQFDIFGFVSFNAQIRKSAHHRSYYVEQRIVTQYNTLHVAGYNRFPVVWLAQRAQPLRRT